MAKVKITGHASGTGVITVTAPNTSTDRTITLPDSTGTILDTTSTLDATKLSGNLPAISGASLTSVNAVNGGRKNMIINGDMMIDQRNAGASATTTASVYMADRFQLYASTINNANTYQQVADAPAGFNKSLKITNSSTAQAAGSAALYTPRQRIEGYNIAHLNWGTSDAQTVTVSFWVKASVTGTYPLTLSNGSLDRSYVTNYTVSVANTWEKKTVTIAGDTSGTWNVDNTTGINVMFSLDSNTTYQTSTVDAWQSASVRATSSNVHFLATASATWQITGVQLELGSVATDFEHRSYGEELALCRRYFQAHHIITHTPLCVDWGAGDRNTNMRGTFHFDVPMRAAPTQGFLGDCNWYEVNADTNAPQALNFTPNIMAAYNDQGLNILGDSADDAITFSAEL